MRVKCRRTGRCRRTKGSKYNYAFLRCIDASAFIAALGRKFAVSLTGDFFMAFFKAFLRSPLLDGQSKNRKIAYLGVMTAFAVIANTLFEFKFMDTQFSLTLAVSSLLGVLLGGMYGFVVCFLGDLIGFLINSSGFAYMPWIGLSMGITSLLTGVLVNGVKKENKGGRYAMIALSCVLSFVVCSVGINTTAFYFLYAGKGVSYWTYFVARFIVKGQLWNCIFNYALVFGGSFLVDKLLATVKK